VSLLPEKIIRDLGLRVELRTRSIASFTPYTRDVGQKALLFSSVNKNVGRDSLRELAGSDAEFQGMEKFYSLSRVFAKNVWDTMLEPLRSKAEFAQRFGRDKLGVEAWRAFVEEPLGCVVEGHLQNDLVRGLVFTDAKIGVFTHPHDESLLQNRCFLYHVIGNRTGEWKVPIGGMGRVAGELHRVAVGRGVEIHTQARITKLHLESETKTVEFQLSEELYKVDARFILVNCGVNVLKKLLGQPYHPAVTHEGSVLKINMLLKRLPRLLAPNHSARDAFCGTFHIDEGYEQMKRSHEQAAQTHLPDKIPCEVYCHTLTDDSILSPDLRARGFHTLTLFALDVPWRLFSDDNEKMRRAAMRKCLDGLNSYLAEPIEDCFAIAKNDEPCIEAKTPVDIENELGHYRGNIFHSALTFPFAENAVEIGTWGVETEYPGVFICGASARRGGAVSGIPGHNAAMKVLASL
jgi:phytoene dehydrogenase-like protein